MSNFVSLVPRNPWFNLLSPPSSTPPATPQKVSGQLDYLIGEYPLWKYDYIRATTTRGVVPDLTIIVESEVEELNENDEVEYIPEMIFEEDIPDDAQVSTAAWRVCVRGRCVGGGCACVAGVCVRVLYWWLRWAVCMRALHLVGGRGTRFGCLCLVGVGPGRWIADGRILS